MKISSFMAASLLAITDTLAHPEHLERSEVARRSAMSKRCEANASNFNKKRHEKAMAKRAWGTGNSTVEITTESSYCKPLFSSAWAQGDPMSLLFLHSPYITQVSAGETKVEFAVTNRI